MAPYEEEREERLNEFRSASTPEALLAVCMRDVRRIDGQMEPGTTYPTEATWILAARHAPMSAWTDATVTQLVRRRLADVLEARADLTPEVSETVLARRAAGFGRSVDGVAFFEAKKAIENGMANGRITGAHPIVSVLIDAAAHRGERYIRRRAVGQAMALRIPDLSDEMMARIVPSTDDIRSILRHPNVGPLTLGAVYARARDLSEEDWSQLYDLPAARRDPRLAQAVVDTYGPIGAEHFWRHMMEDAFRLTLLTSRNHQDPRPGDIGLIRDLLKHVMAMKEGPQVVLHWIQMSDLPVQAELVGSITADMLTDAALSPLGADRTAAMLLTPWASDNEQQPPSPAAQETITDTGAATASTPIAGIRVPGALDASRAPALSSAVTSQVAQPSRRRA